MEFVSHLTAASGDLLLTIPSALIILMSREWFCARMAGDKEFRATTEFSLISFASLSLTGIAPGGLIRESIVPLLRFLHSQLWLLILLAMGIIYVLLKSPEMNSFSARFSAVFLQQTWALFIINFIPLPPFDAATTYFAPYMQWRFFSIFIDTLAILALVIFLYDFWRIDFLTGAFLTRWLGIA